jgi:hypothetical protein
MKVRRVKLNVRNLVTLRADPSGAVELPDVKGALVRFYPAASNTDEEIDHARAAFLAAGAQSVRVMPRPSTTAIVGQAVSSVEHLTARQTVLTLVSESNSTDKHKLACVAQEIMDKVGL